MNEIPSWIKKPSHDWEVSESDLSDAISEFYNRPYQIQQQGDMMGQDETHFYEVDGCEGFDNCVCGNVTNGYECYGGIDGWPSVTECEQAIAEWLSVDRTAFKYDFQYYREHYINPGLALWDMCRKGVIPGR